VRIDDRGDDREPEPAAAARPRRVDAAERIDGTIEVVGRKAVPVIAHAQRDRSVGGAAALDFDLAVSVSERVFDEIDERLLEAQPDRRGRAGLRRA